MDLAIAGHIAIVTGGGRGIGQAIAVALAAEGCKVVVWDRDRASAETVTGRIKATGGEAFAVTGDVARRNAVRRVVDNVLERYGTVHVLVNNAGFSQDAPITAMSDEKWNAVMDVCLKGVFLCTQAVVPVMVKQRYGRIINISSRAHFGEVLKANYSAAKAAVNGMTGALALELGQHNITVNAVAPGLVRTERVKAIPHYKRIERNAIERTPIKRPGSPQDIADGVLFLASQRAGFVTGEILHITGGRFFSN
jgi:3-oxoacyl-[acyl-carrier protein] reductase